MTEYQIIQNGVHIGVFQNKADATEALIKYVEKGFVKEAKA